MRYSKLILTVALFLIGAGAKPLTLRWYGQACFLLTSPGGTAVLMDPFHRENGLEYNLPAIKADAVTVSHEHFDHNNVEAAKPGAKIFHGVTEGGWAMIHETVGDVKIRTVVAGGPFYHDDREGRMRGRDAVFVFETNGMTVVHLGDLGHVLSDEQIQAIGRTDVLLIPVGGYYTIDAAQAKQVVSQLKPKIVIPMHYKTDKVKNIPIAPVDAFLQGQPRVEKQKGSVLEIRELPAETTVFVLRP